jgi:hypothetical protein
MSGIRYPDATNVPNAWQGRLRFGALDLDLLARSISDDQPRADFAVEKTLAMTCIDQVGESVNWWQGGQRQAGTAATLMAAAQSATGLPMIATSHGPCREDVSFSFRQDQKIQTRLAAINPLCRAGGWGDDAGLGVGDFVPGPRAADG